MKMGSIKAGSFWLSKKAKEEFNNITQDLTVCNFITLKNEPFSCFNKTKVVFFVFVFVFSELFVGGEGI